MDDKYLISKYGITLAERAAMVKEQHGLCPACGRALDENCRIEVDHFHFKVDTRRSNSPEGGWVAVAVIPGTPLPLVWEKTKEKAIKLAKHHGKRASVRGVLCGGRYAGCNRKLGMVDRVPWLKNVTAYLENPPAKKVLTNLEPLL